MSEKLLRFLLSELKLVRLLCKKDGCVGGVVELPLNRLTVIRGGCPLCGNPFHLTMPAQEFTNPLTMFAKSAEWLEMQRDNFAVEFVLKDNG
jgi:hypothetical protein